MQDHKPSIAITGSLGFIGSSFVKTLKARNYKVIELSCSEDVDHFFQGPKSDSYLKQIDHVFWVGSKVTPINANQNSDLILLEIEQLERSLERLAVKNSEVRLTFLSSAGAIYTGSESIFNEGSESLGYNAYGKFKKMQEDLVSSFSFPTLVLRASNIYGPGQRLGRGQGVIAEWLNSALNDQPLQVFGSLSVKRDFIFIDDLIEAFMITVEEKMSSNEIFNIVSGYTNSLDEIKLILEILFQKKLSTILLDSRKVDRQEISLSPEKFQKYFKWKPKYDLVSGLKHTYEEMLRA
jgi:UDP-glucose 4-epimerase